MILKHFIKFININGALTLNRFTALMYVVRVYLNWLPGDDQSECSLCLPDLLCVFVQPSHLVLQHSGQIVPGHRTNQNAGIWRQGGRERRREGERADRQTDRQRDKQTDMKREREREKEREEDDKHTNILVRFN